MQKAEQWVMSGNSRKLLLVIFYGELQTFKTNSLYSHSSQFSEMSSLRLGRLSNLCSKL